MCRALRSAFRSPAWRLRKRPSAAIRRKCSAPHSLSHEVIGIGPGRKLRPFLFKLVDAHIGPEDTAAHSLRSASEGAIPAALRVGNRVALSVATASTDNAPVNTSGSKAL